MKSQGIDGVTGLLQAWSGGDPAALEQLIPLVYSELHRLANRYMAGERRAHTLQASALINEAYVRLIDCKNIDWKNRCHFFGVCAQLMRRILVDHARTRSAGKRVGSASRVTLDADLLATGPRRMDLIAVDQALQRLDTFDARKSQVVELRVFGGMTIEEAAEAMNIAVITVRRDWKLALAWLRQELENPNEC